MNATAATVMTSDEVGAFVPEEMVRVGPTGAGPLSGLTFAAKDLIDIAGYVTGGGNPDWRATHPPATRMAPAVASLLAAGAALVGKTISDELAFSLEGANVHYGTPLNSAAPDRLPGGSSSGSAAAVAAKLCDFAIGTDTGGSVRIPASFCGIYGIRPTHGRVSTEGVIAFAPSFDAVGWFARSAAMLRQVGDVLLSGRERAPIRRLILASDVMAAADVDVATAVSAAVAGWSIDGEIALFGGEPEAIFASFRTVQGFEIWQSVGDWITATNPHFGTEIAKRFASTAAIEPAALAEQQRYRAAFRRRMDALLPPGVGIVFPTSPTVPPLKDAPTAEIDAFYLRSLTVNAVAGLAGLPQITLPLASAQGAPVGVSILAGREGDEALMQRAVELTERSHGKGSGGRDD